MSTTAFKIPPIDLLPRKLRPAAQAYHEAVARRDDLNDRYGYALSAAATEAAKAADLELLRTLPAEEVGRAGTPHQDQLAKDISTLKAAIDDHDTILFQVVRDLGVALLANKALLIKSADKAPREISEKLVALIDDYITCRSSFEYALQFRTWVSDINDREPVPNFPEIDEQSNYSGLAYNQSIGAAKLRDSLLEDARRHEDLVEREARQAAQDAKNARAREINEAPHRERQARERVEILERYEREQAAHARRMAEAEAATDAAKNAAAREQAAANVAARQETEAEGVYIKLDGTVVDL